MTNLGKPVTQRQLRVGEMIKQALGMLFISCLLYTSPSPRDGW